MPAWHQLGPPVPDHRRCALSRRPARILGFVKKTQLLADKEEARIGGIKGSHPINGGYHPWQYPNWATKFYADALMMDSANRQGALYK